MSTDVTTHLERVLPHFQDANAAVLALRSPQLTVTPPRRKRDPFNEFFLSFSVLPYFGPLLVLR